MAKKRAVPGLISFRCAPEYREWMRGLAARKHVEPFTALIHLALAECAQRARYEPPPPRLKKG